MWLALNCVLELQWLCSHLGARFSWFPVNDVQPCWWWWTISEKVMGQADKWLVGLTVGDYQVVCGVMAVWIKCESPIVTLPPGRLIQYPSYILSFYSVTSHAYTVSQSDSHSLLCYQPGLHSVPVTLIVFALLLARLTQCPSFTQIVFTLLPARLTQCPSYTHSLCSATSQAYAVFHSHS